jgi:CRP-like cAMP-binding protein
MPVTAPDALRSVPLFEGMSEASITSIGRLTHPVQYGTGDVLVREGDPGDSFIVMVSGRAAVDQGGQRIREMSAGEFLGEISLIDHGPRTATVTALEPIETLAVTAEDFGHLMDAHPAVRLAILTALTHRIRREAAALSD